MSRTRRPTIRSCLSASKRDALTLCRALGYDLNTVEFAVEDGVPYAIDFMNPAPDADLHSVGEANFDWIVDAVAEMAIAKGAKSSTLGNSAGRHFSGQRTCSRRSRPPRSAARRRKSLPRRRPQSRLPQAEEGRGQIQARIASGIHSAPLSNPPIHVYNCRSLSRGHHAAIVHARH